ncbi:MAG: Flp pilus assembly complex ATPase component TadA [Phycisphaerae bacterium]|nr:Flp pilus assembly complex ATPase component TadA [Phycisphaerae bacterium]
MPLKRVNKLGQVLLDEGLVTETDLRRALESQDKDNKRLGEVLMDMGILSPKAMLSALAKQLNVKAVQLRHGLIDPAVARLLDREEAARLKALPLFKVGDTLTVAMAEPQALPTIDRLGALTGCRINPVLALESNIAEFQEKYLGEQVDIDSFLVTLTESEVKVVERETIDEDTSHEISRMVDGSPIINLVNLAIMTAVRDGASDIHVEPTKQATRLRYRIDGNLRELMSAPNSMHAAIVSRIKVIGRMDIAERRLPQEGRVHVVAEGREIDLRVSSMPTLLGEKIVLRILDKSNLNVALDKLGVSADQLPRFRRIFSKPHGIVLVTGPTGSGKTTTLYSVIDLLSSPERNIVTIEDPVEYQLDGINQVQVNEAVQMTFARALRSLLRQDPDVIMVGEIRDTDTARVAIQAALTGHLVLSTLHTNNAPGAFIRLADMGIERYLLASAFNGVVAQRLARTICPFCRTSYYPPESALADAGWLGDTQRVFFKGEGCKQCHDSGFRGRAGIYELLEVTDEVRQHLHRAEEEEEIKAVARQHGWRPLREEGLRLVEEGRSTLEEVLRVTHAETEAQTRAEHAPQPRPALATAASSAGE